MKTWLKYTLAGVVLAGFCTATGFGLHASRVQHSADSCRCIDVRFTDSAEFVSSEDVLRYIESDYGVCVGRKLDSVALGRIENVLNGKSAIRESQAWTTPDGILHVRISQRKPLVRFVKGKGGFYIDETGYIFPLHPTYTAPVITVVGDIPVDAGGAFKGDAVGEDERKWLGGVAEMVAHINGARALCAGIDTLTVVRGGSIEFRKAAHPENILFGRPEDIADKFGRLAVYYDRIAARAPYTTVDLRYKDRIICRQ